MQSANMGNFEQEIIKLYKKWVGEWVSNKLKWNYTVDFIK